MGGRVGVLGFILGHFCVKTHSHFQMGGRWGNLCDFVCDYHDSTIVGVIVGFYGSKWVLFASFWGYISKWGEGRGILGENHTHYNYGVNYGIF